MIPVNSANDDFKHRIVMLSFLFWSFLLRKDHTSMIKYHELINDTDLHLNFDDIEYVLTREFTEDRMY